MLSLEAITANGTKQSYCNRTKRNWKDWRLVGAKKKFHEYGGKENKKTNPVMKNCG